jgi:DNA-binding transcriptional LysR family regulator
MILTPASGALQRVLLLFNLKREVTRRKKIARSGHIVIFLMRLHWATYCSKEYAEKYGLPEKPEDLINFSTLHFATSPEARAVWKMTGPNGVETARIRPRLIANHREALFEGIQNGLGFGVMPEFSMKPYLNAGSVVHLLPEYYCNLMMLQAIYPPSRHLSTKVRLLTDFLVERFEKNVV